MIILRRAREDDVESIQDLASKTWALTYAEYLSKEQIEYMLQKMYNKGELLSQLKAGYTFLVAEENDADIGFAGFSEINAQDGIFKLHKLYVLPEAHGRSVGKLLINEVVVMIKRNNGKVIQLNVNRNNKAVTFYIKAGFIIKETVDLDIGNGFYMNDYLMEKSI